MRVPVINRNDEICDILEHFKFAKFQDIKTHIEGLVDGDSYLFQIESHQVIGEDADTMAFWFA